MTREQIEEKIADLMIKHGPDGHCDGYVVIADFVCVLLKQHECLDED